MYLRRLELAHFRNYEQQELPLAPGRVLFLGENAQGKTNLLEAAFLLASGRSDRSAGDADFIAWSQRDAALPFARVAGTVASDGMATATSAALPPDASGREDAAPPAAARGVERTVELTVVGRASARGELVASKRFKLNGVARRASEVIGAITAVLFTTDDMDLVKGSPAGRRRYLDVMLSQIDRAYLRALQRYTKVISQRNALLRRVQEGDARAGELTYWDEQLADAGARLFSRRAEAVVQLAAAAEGAYARLSFGVEPGAAGAAADAACSVRDERFLLTYLPRFADAWPAERIAATAAEAIAAALLTRLTDTRARDVAAGVTLVGPHRDDLAMTLGGEPAATFASRGQQRTAALALRLAEARLIFERSGERPLLLLDDVLSELDASRRAHVLASLDADQVLITSADGDRFDAAFVAGAQVWRVAGGTAARA
ncbi:MAG: DNA replication and repair protein RecF [Dehalococcoidia bacterium]|nr:DNA replication and repair protein RecF [Dehalococcoidia bacterium]